MKIIGDVIFDKNADYSNVTEITGYVYCSGADTKASFPVLTSIGGYVYCRGADTKASFPVLTSIGGGVDCRGADTKASFPVLTSIGGYVYCSGADTKASFPADAKFNDESCPAISRCAIALMASFLSVGILFADGISAKIISKRKKSDMVIYSVIIVGKTERSIVIEQNSSFSHGETISDAIESLIYKISDRDTSMFKKWNMDTEVSLSEAIKSYRVITGACEQGTRNFCKSQGELKEKYTVKEIVDLTKGAFGSEKYAEFFKG